MADTWKVCSTCRLAIPFHAKYFECSVSTCTRKRTGFFFCSLPCWEAHVPTLRHRDAWAVEAQAPTRDAWERELAAEEGSGPMAMAVPPRASTPVPVPPRPAPSAPSSSLSSSSGSSSSGSSSSSVSSSSSAPQSAPSSSAPGGSVTLSSTDIPRDVLIVVSKLKAYVKARSGMNTSDNVVGPLSELVRKWMDQAVRNAAADGRKTVLDRDIPRS